MIFQTNKYQAKKSLRPTWWGNIHCWSKRCQIPNKKFIILIVLLMLSCVFSFIHQRLQTQSKVMRNILAQLEHCRIFFCCFLVEDDCLVSYFFHLFFCNNAKEMSPTFFLTTCWWLVDFFAFLPISLLSASDFSNSLICLNHYLICLLDALQETSVW